jgi:hypothetical protein
MTFNKLMLINTAKKHWVNGYQERGGGKHKTFALSLGNYAVMLSWGQLCGYKWQIYFYKLLS